MSNTCWGHNALFPVFNNEYNLINSGNSNANSIKINGGVYEIGYQGDDFCYDNELAVHKYMLMILRSTII